MLLPLLTWTEHRKPAVELILVGDGVELAALHLPKRWCAWAAGVHVAQAVAFPFSGAVLASKLWSTSGTQAVLLVSLEASTFISNSPARGHAHSFPNHVSLHPQNPPFKFILSSSYIFVCVVAHEHSAPSVQLPILKESGPLPQAVGCLATSCHFLFVSSSSFS